MPKILTSLLGLSGLALTVCCPKAAMATAVTYQVVQSGTSTVPNIVLQWDGTNGINWGTLATLKRDERLKDQNLDCAYLAVTYMQEAIKKMTGKTCPIISSNNLTSGIVFTTLANAPSDIKTDPDVIYGLRDTGSDAYNSTEAFYVRTQAARTFIVANTPQGFAHGAMGLLETVNYAVLAVGPNWIFAPSAPNLAFNWEAGGRPGMYIRHLNPTSGQDSGGIGTINIGQIPPLKVPTNLPDATDEIEEVSFDRYRFGTHMGGTSEPKYLGHYLDIYHYKVLKTMIDTDNAHGFLLKATVDPESLRPPADATNVGEMWVNQDPIGTPEYFGVFISTFKNGAYTWVQQPVNLANKTATVRGQIDVSVPYVRQIVFDDVKIKSEAAFAAAPSALAVQGTEPEDGGPTDAQFAATIFDGNWYPAYLASKGLSLNQTYKVNGYLGLNQPTELWSAPGAGLAAQSDHVFAFNNWLLREFDSWLDSGGQYTDANGNPRTASPLTSTGKSKKSLMRTSLFSYSFHDVPPEFNLDSRIRVSIASYPVHRGVGKWMNFKTANDIAGAFKKLVLSEPSAEYWIQGYAPDQDDGLEDIYGGHSTAYLQKRVNDAYNANVKAIDMEIDFDFGKYGLDDFLLTRMFYLPAMTSTQLDNYRTTWMNRAFGAGASKMSQYYDMMTREKWINAPSFWGKAINLIEQADALIPDTAPEQKRLDDVKQFWYYYYLVDTGKTKVDNEFKEFAWKGQMSYITAMHMVTRRIFGITSSGGAATAAGSTYVPGPAHYTHAETQVWWNGNNPAAPPANSVVGHWQQTNPLLFSNSTLANGVAASTVNMNDLVQVSQFQKTPASSLPSTGVLYDGTNHQPYTFLTTVKTANTDIGCHVFWSYAAGVSGKDVATVPYTMEYYDAALADWRDVAAANQPTQTMTWSGHSGTYQGTAIRYTAPWTGLYRITVGPGTGSSDMLFSLDYDPATNTQSSTLRGQSSTIIPQSAKYLNSQAWIYVPKTQEIVAQQKLDVEIWDSLVQKTIHYYTGLPYQGTTLFHQTRTEIIPAGFKGLKTLVLNPNEIGSLIQIEGNGSVFSPFMYSAPQIWAIPHEGLLVPRAVAVADGLTPIAP